MAHSPNLHWTESTGTKFWRKKKKKIQVVPYAAYDLEHLPWVNYKFHQPEIRWFGGYSPHKPPFGVRSRKIGVLFWSSPRKAVLLIATQLGSAGVS